MAQDVGRITRDTWQNATTIQRAATPVAPVITTTALPNGRVAQPYDQTIQATGNPSPSAAITAGALPAGLALTSAARRIAGTPTAPVNASFEVTATNSAGSDVGAFSILVPNEGTGGDAPAVTTVTLVPAAADVLPGATVDLLLTIEDQNGSPIENLIGTVTSDSANATAEQLAASDATGQATVRVTGVTAGAASVSVTVDSVQSNTCSVTVLDAVAPTITTTTLPDAIIGQSYSVQIEADGSPTLTYTLDSGSLGEFSLSSDGLLSVSNVSVSASLVFVVKTENAYGSDTQALTLVAREAVVVSSVTVSPETVTIAPGAQTQLSAVVAGTGAFSPNVTWSVVSGGGSISSGGIYTAPSAPAVATVRATSVTDPTKFDEATVTVEAPATTDAIRVPGIRCGLYQGSTLLMPIRITMTSGSAEGQTITAASSDPSKVSVSPSAAVTDVDGKATFTLSFVAGGQSTITFASGAMSSEMLAITRVGGDQ